MSSAYNSVMLEIFQNFEQMTARFSPSILIGSVVVFLLLGLCLWLSGLALRKILISLVGLAGGIVVGLFVVGRNIFSASLSAAIAALIALIFEKVLVILLAAALAAAIAFRRFFSGWPLLELSLLFPIYYFALSLWVGGLPARRSR